MIVISDLEKYSFWLYELAGVDFYVCELFVGGGINVDCRLNFFCFFYIFSIDIDEF